MQKEVVRMSKYKLLPVQVENLTKQHYESLAKLQALNVIKNEEFADKKIATGKELNLGLDTSLLGTLSVAIKEYKDAKEKLESYELLEPNNSDIIGLGSTFELTMNYGELEETEVFTLVETHNTNDDHNFISISSPLGNAVNGHIVGDSISYMVEKRMITGTVTNIIKQKTL